MNLSTTLALLAAASASFTVTVERKIWAGRTEYFVDFEGQGIKAFCHIDSYTLSCDAKRASFDILQPSDRGMTVQVTLGKKKIPVRVYHIREISVNLGSKDLFGFTSSYRF